jgi:hypothetical protein
MAYTVVESFMDLEDNKHIYKKGDIYPNKGVYRPSKERISYLSSNKNNKGRPLIKIVKSTKETG